MYGGNLDIENRDSAMMSHLLTLFQYSRGQVLDLDLGSPDDIKATSGIIHACIAHATTHGLVGQAFFEDIFRNNNPVVGLILLDVTSDSFIENPIQVGRRMEGALCAALYLRCAGLMNAASTNGRLAVAFDVIPSEGHNVSLAAFVNWLNNSVIACEQRSGGLPSLQLPTPRPLELTSSVPSNRRTSQSPLADQPGKCPPFVLALEFSKLRY